MQNSVRENITKLKDRQADGNKAFPINVTEN